MARLAQRLDPYNAEDSAVDCKEIVCQMSQTDKVCSKSGEEITDLMLLDIVNSRLHSAENNAETPESGNNCDSKYERPSTSELYGEFISLKPRRCGMKRQRSDWESVFY